jgi:hypothetical protein
MSDKDESVVRSAYEAYGRGDFNRLLELVHPDLEWTYLDPGVQNPQPQTCHGRAQLARVLGQQADRGPGDTGHIAGMGAGYVAMLTAFYVDNGPHLPLWDRLPTLAFWLLPSAIGAPIIARAVIRARRAAPEKQTRRTTTRSGGEASTATANGPDDPPKVVKVRIKKAGGSPCTPGCRHER